MIVETTEASILIDRCLICSKAFDGETPGVAHGVSLLLI